MSSPQMMTILGSLADCAGFDCCAISGLAAANNHNETNHGTRFLFTISSSKSIKHAEIAGFLRVVTTALARSVTLHTQLRVAPKSNRDSRLSSTDEYTPRCFIECGFAEPKRFMSP